MSYENARQTIFDAWINSFGGNATECWNYVNSLKLSQNDIRLENKLTAANTNYLFGTIQNQVSTTNIQFATEERLNQQDTLIATEFAVMVGLAANDNDTLFEIFPFANPAIFGAADAAIINAGLYANGKIKISVNNDVIVPSRRLLANKYVPETQLTAAPGAGSPITEFDGAVDGLVTMEPNIYLIGSKNSVPEIILPSALTGLSSANVRVVLLFSGFTAQNSTVVS